MPQLAHASLPRIEFQLTNQDQAPFGPRPVWKGVAAGPPRPFPCPGNPVRRWLYRADSGFWRASWRPTGTDSAETAALRVRG